MQFSLIDATYRACGRLLVSRSNWLAAALLALMFGLGVTSLRNDSATFDEVAHIPAGYSYLRYGEFRLNPEHPPLIKDLAALPLLFLKLNFPVREKSWTTEMNGQWEAGRQFLYTTGNDADRILLWARLPVLVFAIGFGAFLYVFCRRRFGASVALLALFFYALSPNFLAHARYVTTDVGSSASTFVVLVAFDRFIDRPGRASVWWLGLALAVAQFVKFSAIALYPFLACVTAVVVWLWPNPARLWARIKVYFGGVAAASVLSALLLVAFYYPHTMNMPISVQDRLVVGSMIPGTLEPLARRLLELNKLPLMPALVQYVLGLTMVLARVKIGTWTYFNGEVIRGSFRWFFPEIFVLKTQIAFLLMAVASIAVFLQIQWRSLRTFATHLRAHFFLWLIAGFAAFYFALAVAGNLNLGIRHLLPIYAPLFLLVAVATGKLLRELAAHESDRWLLAVSSSLTSLLGWYAISTVATHPSYTAYFNEFAGGPAEGDRYFSGSNVDWGQDLRRLRSYVNDHPEIKHIAIDYFGGGDVKYYFCSREQPSAGEALSAGSAFDCRGSVYDDWTPANGPYAGEYIAVSQTNLARDPLFGDKYAYLRGKAPIVKIGYSIDVFKIR